MQISRRQWLAGTAAFAGLGAIGAATGGRVAAAPKVAAGSDAATVKKLYQRALVMDLQGQPGSFDKESVAGTLADIRSSGVTVVSFTVGVEDYDDTIATIAEATRLVDEHADRLLLVRRHADLAAAKRSGRLALVLNTQGSLLVGRDLERVDALGGLGVRIFQLTYNRGDLVGDGCLEPRDAGLTVYGRQLVERLDAQHIAIDVSHCGRRTTREGITVSKRPVLVTHSGCSAVFEHPRNKDDETLKLMADRGGVLGLYFMPFLGRPADGGPATLALLLDHVDHAVRVCGEDHVGFGTDNSLQPVPDTDEQRKNEAAYVARRRAEGIGAPEEERTLHIPELNHLRRFETVALAMAKRGQPARVIEKVLGANFDRALKEAWKA